MLLLPLNLSSGGVAPSKLKYWNGSIWAIKPLKYWNGTTWLTKPIKVWNGISWV